jgi:hypothetical protein
MKSREIRDCRGGGSEAAIAAELQGAAQNHSGLVLPAGTKIICRRPVVT